MSLAISTEAHDRIRKREAILLALAFGFLLVNAVALALTAAGRVGVPGLSVLSVVPAWGASAWLLHRVLNRRLPDRDPFLLPSGLLLMGWGILVIWRLLPEFGARQLAWFLAVTALIFEVARMQSVTAWLRRYRLVWLLGGLFLLALTLFMGTNPSGGESRLWLGCCGQYFQPSEPLRLLLIAYLASFLADRMLPGSEEPARYGLRSVLVPLLVVWGLAVALLAAQRDLGAGSLFLALLVVVLYLAFRRWEILLVGLGLLITAGVAAASLSSVVQARVETWLNPWDDPLTSSYQSLQALFALASGGLVGAGPGLGSPGLVPAIHTDYIFVAMGEEWGLAGGLGVLALLAVITSRGLRAATLSRDNYSAILAAGLSIAIGLQAFIILGGVLRLVPLTGVTLPFVSYGGSSLLTTGIAFAVLIRISARQGDHPRFAAVIRRIHAAGIVLWAALALSLGWWMIVRGPALSGRAENPRSHVPASPSEAVPEGLGIPGELAPPGQSRVDPSSRLQV
ncbi:MAG TPA: FtsW/RodA/SpoVE family cell cycle protein [Anaerolineales bacterium]|nr:FtsW/RodA/SpoVE family cell cycle protein [Anaerolineales bacterium]